ncbi:MAG: hypothetical protein J1F02_05005 [Lachnospiraceae bacterium]|nr:hypothetical protein [Lachnospiraceae bacterium]
MSREILEKIDYLVGSADIIESMPDLPLKVPFADDVKKYLSDVSKVLMKDSRSKQHSDVITFAFWIRKASIAQLEDRYAFEDKNFHLGRGIAFHIAPSNVPVNFAYSLVSGLLTGNANIVRVPSKDFPQVEIIADAIRVTLERYKEMKPYIALIRYEHNKDVNDELSLIADTRIIWGGDRTIEEVRKSSLPPRSTEITFADRYSIALIDSDAYMEIEDKMGVAFDFYNDTYFSDQNACTSPRVVIWTGDKKEEAKEIFWNKLYEVVKEKYLFQDIQGVNKLTSALLSASMESEPSSSVDDSMNKYGAHVEEHDDNLMIRVSVKKIDSTLMNYMDNCGFFFEYDCRNIMELKVLCNDKKCQTIGMLGNAKMLEPLVRSGIKGVDRVVSIGHTMDFDFLWDGYQLIQALTRVVCFNLAGE